MSQSGLSSRAAVAVNGRQDSPSFAQRPRVQPVQGVQVLSIPLTLGMLKLGGRGVCLDVLDATAARRQFVVVFCYGFRLPSHRVCRYHYAALSRNV